MSGSLLPLKTFVNSNGPLYAPAGSGGGGGGGGPTQSISSITNLSSILFANGPGDGVNPYVLNIYGQGAPSEVAFNNGGISAPTPAAVYTGLYASTLVNALSGSYAGCFFATQDPGGVNSQLVVGSILNDGNVIASTDQNRNTAPLNVIANPLAVSSFVVSSINGAQYPPAPTDSFSTISVSSIQSGVLFLENINAAGQYPYRMRANSGSAFIENSATGEPGDLLVSTITVSSIVANNTSLSGLTWQNATNCGSLSMTGSAVLSGVGTVQSQSLNALSSITGQFSYVSSIYNISNVGGWNQLPPSYPVPNLLPLGLAGNQFQVNPCNMIQAGFAENVPYASTVLFTYPYPSDNMTPLVIITPTNTGVSGGANPNISLNASFGPNLTGVSTIGFQVDTRNGGVGYTASFMWLAIPHTT